MTVYGVDHPNCLILNGYIENFYSLKELFYRRINDDSFIFKSMIAGHDTCNCCKINKDDNYNFEELISKQKIEYKIRNFLIGEGRLPIIYPVYILRNKKWHYCSPDTDFILIPCEGEFTDLSSII